MSNHSCPIQGWEHSGLGCFLPEQDLVAACGWQQLCHGAKAHRCLPTEASVGTVTFPRGLSRDPALGAGLAKNSGPKGLAKGQLCYIIITRAICDCWLFHLLFTWWMRQANLSLASWVFSPSKNSGIKKCVDSQLKK